MQQFAEVFKALGNSNRLAIVRRLMDRAVSCCEGDRVEDCCLDPASCNVGELAADLDVSPSTVSYHLKELERAGLVEKARQGTEIFIRIDEEAITRLGEFFATGDVT